MNNQKLFYLVSFCLLACSKCLFGNNFIGNYAGIDVGMNYLYGTRHDRETDGGEIDNKGNIDKLGACFGAYFGHLMQMKNPNWLWGFEAFVRQCSVKKKFSQLTDGGVELNELTIKKPFSLGAKIKLGKTLSKKWLFYGFTGINLSQFEYKMKVADIQPIKVTTHQSVKKFIFGIIYGIGCSYAISSKWTSSIELANVNYLSKKFARDTQDGIFRAKIKANDLRFSIKLSKFF